MNEIMSLIHQHPFLTLIFILAVIPALFKFVINLVKSVRGEKVDNNYDI